MPEPTGAQLHDEPDAVVALLAQGGLNASEATVALAQTELDTRARHHEHARVRRGAAAPEQPATVDERLRDLRILGEYLTVEVDRANAALAQLRRDVVAIGQVLAGTRRDEEDGA